MESKRAERLNHKPQRTCMACREVDFKPAMVRLAALPEGVVIDRGGKLAGRGGYLHARRECYELFAKIKGNWFNSLRRNLDRTERANLVKMLAEQLAPNTGVLYNRTDGSQTDKNTGS